MQKLLYRGPFDQQPSFQVEQQAATPVFPATGNGTGYSRRYDFLRAFVTKI